MKNKAFRNYMLFSLAGILLASSYPIYMGISVIVDMIRYGTVYAENYPKYVIPYTPIALSLLVGVALIPIAMKLCKKYALLFGTGISAGVFFAFEFILENAVVVTKTAAGDPGGNGIATLEDWQMFMCYVPRDSLGEGVRTEVDVLMGEYSPAFKLHFYVISIVLIVSVLNCFYGFAKMIQAQDKSRRKSLILQSVTSGAFLGMCIWACFTAFYRDGAISVSPLSAVLMSVFFVLFGVTVGVYVASFLLDKRLLISVGLPSLSAATVTLIMYVGEMILLSGHLYRFGEGFFFRAIPGIVLAPIDVIIILASALVTALIAGMIRNKNAGSVVPICRAH